MAQVSFEDRPEYQRPPDPRPVGVAKEALMQGTLTHKGVSIPYSVLPVETELISEYKDLEVIAGANAAGRIVFCLVARDQAPVIVDGGLAGEYKVDGAAQLVKQFIEDLPIN